MLMERGSRGGQGGEEREKDRIGSAQDKANYPTFQFCLSISTVFVIRN